MKKLFIKSIIVVSAFMLCLNINAQTMNAFAGTGGVGYSGDGASAVNALLYSPYGLAADASGNVYFAEYYSHIIRKVNSSGVISTFAGIAGSNGFSGDGAAANLAQLNFPTAVAVDAVGNVYIAEAGNQRVRKVNTSGIISTFAGTGVQGFSGNGGQATNAKLSSPSGLAVDATGNVYIADYGNNRIRKVNTSGVISTFAGTNTAGYSGDGGIATSAKLNGPLGLAVDAVGNLYAADLSNHRVRVINTSGIISTFAGTGVQGYSGDAGAASSAQISSPNAMAVDAAGNIYIADYGNYRIRKVNTSGIISTYAGTGVSGNSGDGGPALSAQMTNPCGICIDASNVIYFSDYVNNRVRKITTCVNPTLTVNNATVCSGITVNLSASGATTYNWNTGAITSSISVTPTITTNYTVTGNSFGCTDTKTLTVTVNALPTINANTNNTLICIGQTATLNIGGSAATYSVNSVSSNTSLVISPTITTNYTISGTGTNGCMQTVIFTQSVSACTGLDNILSNQNSKLLVFPNPNAGEFTLQSDKNIELTITNALGQFLQTLNLNDSNNYQTQVTNLQSGIYFIIGQNNNLTIKQKIVIAR